MPETTESKIDTRDVAKQLIEIGENVQTGLPKFWEDIKEFLVGILKDLKKVVGVKPTKEEFIKILADYAELRYVSTNPILEMVDGIVFHEGFKLLDKLVTKIHKDWYDDLWKAFEKLDDKIQIAQLNEVITEQEAKEKSENV